MNIDRVSSKHFRVRMALSVALCLMGAGAVVTPTSATAAVPTWRGPSPAGMRSALGHLNTRDGHDAGGFYKNGPGDQQGSVVNTDRTVPGNKLLASSQYSHAPKA